MLEPKIGLLFSGQGSQVPELGKDFYEAFPLARAWYDRYPAIRDLAFHGSEAELAQTQNTQRVLILFHIAVTDLLKQLLTPSAAMGISLGEYGALYAAQSLTAEAVVEVIEKRADAMAAAAGTLPLSSAAVLGSDFTWLIEHAGEHSYFISNINSPSQMVITGKNLAGQGERILAAGYKKLIPLSVSGGFHSPFMQEAEKALRLLFQELPFAEPQIPIYFNYGQPQLDIKTRMAEQVSHTINVHQSLEKITEHCDLLIEIGANSILEKMVKKIDRSKTILPLQTVEDFEKVRQAIGK